MTDRNKSVISKKGTSGLEPLKTTYMTITFDRLQICAIFLHPRMRLINTLRLVPISMSHSFWFKSYAQPIKAVNFNLRMKYRTY